METLTQNQLLALIRSVFPPLAGEKALVFLVDIPAKARFDTPAWQKRREMVFQWNLLLQSRLAELNLESVDLVAYPMVHSNNADLPQNWKIRLQK